MNRKTALLLVILLAACSRLSTLTPDALRQAETKWESFRPVSYRMTIEMQGDRVEKELFEVRVRSGQVETLLRNGRGVLPASSQDYSMDGLFHMLRQEMELAEKPALLGAPAGYGAYIMARFDDATGRLLEYRRTVGGTSNTIEIRVLEFLP